MMSLYTLYTLAISGFWPFVGVAALTIILFEGLAKVIAAIGDAVADFRHGVL